MYKILIVDDEAVVREGIRDNMNWESLGYEVAGCCENGRDAIEAVDRLKPHLVLTDIYMPFVDGIELARYIYENHPDMRVIILTGFDEFEYAQQAIKLKAYDFLLKPITASELAEILTRVKNDLDDEKKKLDDLSSLKMQLRESLPLLKERFLNRLISGHLRQGELQSKLEYFSIALQGKYHVLLNVDIDDYGEMGRYHPDTEDELLLFAVFNICEELAANYRNSVVFQNRSSKNIIILSGDAEDKLLSSALSLSEEIRQAVESYLKFTVTIGVGITCENPADLAKSYKSSLSALDYRFILGKNRVINISDMELAPVNSFSLSKEIERKLSLSIKLGTPDEVSEVINGVIAELKKSFIPVKRCIIHLQQLLAVIFETVEDTGADGNLFADNTNLFSEIYNFRTLDEIGEWLKGSANRAAAAIAGSRSDLSKVQILKAEEFIRSNYSDQELSLSSLCKHLFISASYFSLIFKQHTGGTFIEYLTRIRMEKAMELLKTTNLKTYEVSERVGFGDPHYFSITFKKYSGLTPTEYRENSTKGTGL